MDIREKLHLMDEVHARNEGRIREFMTEHALEVSYLVEKHMEGEMPGRNDIVMVMGENVAQIMARSLYAAYKAKGYHVTVTECRPGTMHRVMWVDGELIPKRDFV